MGPHGRVSKTLAMRISRTRKTSSKSILNKVVWVILQAFVFILFIYIIDLKHSIFPRNVAFYHFRHRNCAEYKYFWLMQLYRQIWRWIMFLFICVSTVLVSLVQWLSYLLFMQMVGVRFPSVTTFFFNFQSIDFFFILGNLRIVNSIAENNKKPLWMGFEPHPQAIKIHSHRGNSNWNTKTFLISYKLGASNALILAQGDKQIQTNTKNNNFIETWQRSDNTEC